MSYSWLENFEAWWPKFLQNTKKDNSKMESVTEEDYLKNWLSVHT